MHTSETTQTDSPLAVIAYDDKARAMLAASLGPHGVRAVPCSTFCEAERFALREPCRGILVDLAAMTKAQAEEKAVAYTLTRFYPTLQMKTMGTMLVPMAMAGDTKQDKSLADFLIRTCTEFTPRLLRANKRKDICIQTYIESVCGFTLNISWSGLFIVDMNPGRFSVGEQITVSIPDFRLAVKVIVSRIQGWGQHRPPGIGVKFMHMGQELEFKLFTLLRSDKDTDRDRLVA